MPNLLTASASVDCGHGGAITPKDDPQVKLTVSGAKVLTAAALLGQPVSTCLTQLTPPPPATPVSSPCLQCMTIDSATSTKLTVHGVPVLLAPLHGTTNGMVSSETPQTKLKATGVQSKLTAV
jgi:hypothetical protein